MEHEEGTMTANRDSGQLVRVSAIAARFGVFE